MKHLKSFENYTNEELIEEGLFGKSLKDLINQVGNLDENDEESVKNLFTELFTKQSKISDLAMKLWVRARTNIDKYEISNLLECLQSAKKDFESTGKVGYVGAEGLIVKYKPSGNVKTVSGFADGGSGGKTSLGGV